MLGKYEWEILEEMSPYEYTRWNALLDIEAEDEAEAHRKARMRRK